MIYIYINRYDILYTIYNMYVYYIYIYFTVFTYIIVYNHIYIYKHMLGYKKRRNRPYVTSVCFESQIFWDDGDLFAMRPVTIVMCLY